ncbi:MAG: hemolysin III family protein [Gemmataceae bacterium]
MDVLGFREPVSSWTHLTWMLLAIPGLIPLWKAAGNDGLKRLGALVFGGTLIFCFAGSFLFHSVPATWVNLFRTMDHVGIFLLIAGTVTPIGLVVLDGWWRRGLVGGIWLLAGAGIAIRLRGPQPMIVMTTFYLFMGWVGCATCCELARRLSFRGLFYLVMGGVFYTAGAIINCMHWLRPFPGIFEAHEIFHLFVMAGSLCHYLFIVQVVLPYQAGTLAEPDLRPLSLGFDHAKEGVVAIE